MKKTLTLCLTFISLLGLTSAKAAEPETAFLSSLSSQVIGPAYQTLLARASALQAASEVCLSDKQNSEQVLQEMKPLWRATMSAWQELQWINFGPVIEQNRQWRLQFWPDKKNIVGRKMKNLLTLSAVSQQDLEQAGVLVQGLPAMEYLLYDAEATKAPSAALRCEISARIAYAIKQTSAELAEAWPQYAKGFIKAQRVATSEEDPTVNPHVNITISSLSQFLSQVADQKLKSPFAINLSRSANGYFLESWRSQSSLDNVSENLSGIEKVYHQGGLKGYLIAKRQPAIAKQIEQQLAAARKTIDQYDFAFFQQLSSPEDKSFARIVPLFNSLHQLAVTVEKDLIHALGIQVGFNASDGDS